jgi:hypothetical protein
LTYLEIAYLSYYPVLPLALVALYLSGQRLTPLRFGPWFSWLPRGNPQQFRPMNRPQVAEALAASPADPSKAIKVKCGLADASTMEGLDASEPDQPALIGLGPSMERCAPS